MKKISPKFLFAFGVLFLIGICVVGAILLYFPNKVRAVYSRPLVLIHQPLNQESISLGDHALVNATARNKSGVRRVELWVDDVFYFAQEAAPGNAPPALVLMVPWEPLGGGEHTLVVRAISADDVAGQASIRIWAEKPPSKEHSVSEGETLESIAEDYGVGKDDIREENPDMASDGPAAGETIDIPGGGSSPGAGSPPSGGAPPPSSDEPPPAPSDTAPGDVSDVIEEIGVDLPDPADDFSPDPVSVQVEALALQTGAAYEALHCYASMGHLEPQWYPDADRDQSTDESFASLGGTDWDVAEHLGGDHAPFFTWPGNEPMPFDITCVGITGGGTDSHELGRVEIIAEPDMWDGIPRRAESREGEGSFELEYSISRRSGGMGFPTILDTSIPSPFNLRIERTFELNWDWEPSPDMEAVDQIDGFYVYVNDTLQFTVYDHDTRAIWLPPEWFNPPCGIEYSITMEAWREDPEHPTGEPRWSERSEALVIERDNALEECDITAYVSFNTLTINHYGEDEIGPILMFMNVNSELSSDTLVLDGSCSSGDPGCVGLMLEPDLDYSIGWLMILSDDPHYVEVPLTTEGLGLSVSIYELEDSGSDGICEGTIHIPGDELYGPEGETEYTGTLISHIPDERCHLEFSISSEIAASSYDGLIRFPPLPQLGIEEIIISGERYGINVHNYSSGTWTTDLEVLMTRNNLDMVSFFTIPDFVLFPGDETDIFDPDMPRIERPEDLCVTLDPYDLVEESVERDNPGWRSLPHCIDIPDLVIENAGFDSDSNLIITVQNRGSGPIESNEIRIRVINSLGLERVFVGFISRDGLYPGERAPIEIARSGLEDLLSSYEGRYGLTLVVDPTDEIVESDESNNTFAFGDGPGRIRVIWGGFDYSILEDHLGGYTYTGLSVTYYPVEDEHNYDYFHTRIYVEDGVESRLVDQFDIACTVVRGSGEEPDYSYGEYTHTCLGRVDEHNPTTEFYLANGESVTITVSGEIYDDDAELSGSREDPYRLGSMTFYFDAEEIAVRSGCGERHPQGIHKDLYTYPSGFGVPWYAGFTLCAVSE